MSSSLKKLHLGRGRRSRGPRRKEAQVDSPTSPNGSPIGFFILSLLLFIFSSFLIPHPPQSDGVGRRAEAIHQGQPQLPALSVAVTVAVPVALLLIN